MPYSFNVGSIRCHILSDGKTLADGGGFFGLIPRLLWQKVIQPDENNMIPSDTRTLLIESNRGLILVDTGYGDKLDPKVRSRLGLSETDRIIRQMAQLGFKAADVGIVILTHYHGDHAGGATRWDTPDHTPGSVIATYPNAHYYGQIGDLDEANHPNERTSATYFSANWQPLIDASKLTLLDQPTRIAHGVRTEFAPGHTAGLQIVWVEDGGESLVFLGDSCNWAAHMNRLAWVPSFDILPMTSIETKRRLRQEILQRNALMVFQHDAVVVTARLVEGKAGVEVKPEIIEEVAR
ncbi:MAG: MBL fold metallo-hydrolase [Caldilineaceae bacterium]